MMRPAWRYRSSSSNKLVWGITIAIGILLTSHISRHVGVMLAKSARRSYHPRHSYAPPIAKVSEENIPMGPTLPGKQN